MAHPLSPPRATNIEAAPNPGRRAWLRGAGVAVALPALEAFMPRRATAAAPAPVRLAFIMFPNGVDWSRWRPSGEGRDFRLGDAFARLAPLRDRLQVFTGFAHDNGRSKGDGAGDHARSNAVFLTAAHPKRTAGADIRLGVSVDQVAARHIGHLTRIPSLELGTTRTRRSGDCDAGYACAYQYNLSWATETVPLPPEADPRRVFERLFGAGPPRERARLALERARARRSVLDFVTEDARALREAVGVADRHKLDEHAEAVRAIERQMAQAESFGLPRTRHRPPTAIPTDHGAHIRLLSDLLALAFETDSTRVASFAFAHEGSNRSFAELGIAEGHHSLSHHEGDAEKVAKIARIDRFYLDALAHFLRRLAGARDVDGRSVLDNAAVLYGCATSDGNRHTHHDLPILLAGGGGGRLRPGRHVKLPEEVPLANLFVTMLAAAGVEVDRFGDSTGRFDDA